jgi:hypothetical protein
LRSKPKAIWVGDRQVDNQPQDRREEEDAGQVGAEAETAFPTRRSEVVADRSAERAGEDVGEPKGEDRVHPQAEMQHGDDDDRCGEDAQRRQVAEFELLGEEMALQCGAPPLNRR